VTEEWGKLHYEELCNLYTIKYYYDDQIKQNEMGVACSKHWGGGGGCKKYVQNFDWKT
jgi:hypothetical protein